MDNISTNEYVGENPIQDMEGRIFRTIILFKNLHIHQLALVGLGTGVKIVMNRDWKTPIYPVGISWQRKNAITFDSFYALYLTQDIAKEYWKRFDKIKRELKAQNS